MSDHDGSIDDLEKRRREKYWLHLAKERRIVKTGWQSVHFTLPQGTPPGYAGDLARVYYLAALDMFTIFKMARDEDKPLIVDSIYAELQEFKRMRREILEEDNDA